MAVEAVSVLLANVEAIGVIGAATVTFELWKQQRFVRNLAKDINSKYRSYKGKSAGNCDRLLRNKVEALCINIRDNVNKQHSSGTIETEQSRRLIGQNDSIIRDNKSSPRGTPWRVNWRLRRKLSKIDRSIIDSLSAGMVSSSTMGDNSPEKLSKYISDVGEALTRRTLLVSDT